MNRYYCSYGPVQINVATLKEAKAEAKRISAETIYPINIIHNGDVIGTYVPKLSKSGRWSFRYKAVR